MTDDNGITDADVGFDVALDSSNNAYVTGTAFSTDFPTPGGLQTALAGAGTPPEQNPNVFVAKFNYTNAATPADSLVWSTYLGAEGDTVDLGDGDGDLGYGIAVNPAGTEVFVVGQTYSGNPLSSPVHAVSRHPKLRRIRTVQRRQACQHQPGLRLETHRQRQRSRLVLLRRG